MPLPQVPPPLQSPLHTLQQLPQQQLTPSTPATATPVARAATPVAVVAPLTPSVTSPEKNVSPDLVVNNSNAGSGGGNATVTATAPVVSPGKTSATSGDLQGSVVILDD